MKPNFIPPTAVVVRAFTVSVCLLGLGTLADESQRSSFKFDFGPGKVAPGYTQVLPKDIYRPEIGFGFEPGPALRAMDNGEDALRGDFVTSDKPFCFSVAVPDGNYKVTVTLAGPDDGSATTIKAELRRLMLEKVRVAKGEFATRAFTVNVRTPKIAGGGAVSLKPRERTSEFRAWDEKLTLEFNGSRPCLCALEITRADDLPTVYLLGDSTVCDQPLEPWNSWGQMLPRFLTADVVVANHAESGETIKGSLGARRFDKVFSTMKTGDYLFLQFGHNDMKDQAPDALATYRSNLKRLVAETRRKGGTPVLITSVERKNGVEQTTLGNYPATVREVAAEEKTALIDLNAMSRDFYKALGPEKLGLAFQDGTHHNNYGSYELAQCVVQGIKSSNLDLAKFIVDDFKGFNPAHPDPVENFTLPPSPGAPGAQPLGN